MEEKRWGGNRRIAGRENEKVAVGDLREKISVGQLAMEQHIICELHQKTDA